MLPEIPGELLSDQAAEPLIKCLAKLFGTSRLNFPGAQPVSFARESLEYIVNEEFLVSEKADGVRVLVWATVNGCGEPCIYLIDRKNCYYSLNFGFPRLVGLGGGFHVDTVLDAEIVVDVLPNGKHEIWLLLFDCMIVDGKCITDRTYSKRLGHMNELVLRPFTDYLRKNTIYGLSMPFKMKLKKLEKCHWLTEVFNYIKTLNHKSDGLIFTSVSAPYPCGTCEQMLKWKPADENTVDFLLGKDYNGQLNISVLQRDGIYKKIGPYKPEKANESWNHQLPDTRIIECKYDKNWPGYWRFCRFRDDKSQPNHVSVYYKVMKSIEDNITKDVLLQYVPRIREAAKMREARHNRK